MLSAFLDNIAAAMIGATVAARFSGRSCTSAISPPSSAASNAGGSGSVVGDTTTTMMWLDGVAPLDVVHAYVAAVAAFIVFAIPAARQQQRFSPIEKDAEPADPVDWARVIIVVLILGRRHRRPTSMRTNCRRSRPSAFPYIGATVIGVLLLLTPWRRPDWRAVPAAVKGSVFLLSLVLMASMMPVEQLPAASSQRRWAWASSRRCSTTFR